MLTFLAYGGDADKRQLIVDRVAGLVKFAKLADGQGNASPRIDMIEVLADGPHDLAVAHKNSGFTAPLLQICDCIIEGLPADEAPPFALALVKAAHIDTDIGTVPHDFMKWMFEAAVAELGLSQIRSTAREIGHVFDKLVDASPLTSAQQRHAKAAARQAQRRGTQLPIAEEQFVAEALGAALDSRGQLARTAVQWMADIAEQPTGQYRRFAKKLIELVEHA